MALPCTLGALVMPAAVDILAGLTARGGLGQDLDDSLAFQVCIGGPQI